MIQNLENQPLTGVSETDTQPQLSQEAKARMLQANEGRDQSIYHWRMDAAKMSKVESLMSIMRDLKDGMVIVDAGSGTGAVLETIGELAHQQNRRVKLIALDISHEHVDLSGREPLLALAFGDAAEQNFPDASVDVIYFSTSAHEISSFGGGPERIKTALKNAYRQLRSEGQVIIRDFVKPEITGPIFMTLPFDDGEDVGLDVPSQDVNYNKLSTMAKFKRFHAEFAGGNAFEYQVVERDGRSMIKIEAEWAYEFYMRKEYTGNWRNEIKEKYSFWTMAETRAALEAAGFTDIEIRPDNSQYMLSHWLEGQVGLYTENADGQLELLPFPPTHMLASGRKPLSVMEPALVALEGRSLHETKVPSLKEVLQSFVVDTAAGKITFYPEHRLARKTTSPQVFEITGESYEGNKFVVYRLKDHPERIIKVPRQDNLATRSDEHILGQLTSMSQIVERQDVLEQYHTPHLQIHETDPAGPPYRYVVQDALPAEAESVADLIRRGELGETEIRQMCEIVALYELDKQYQLDTNPFAWYRVKDEDGQTKLLYTSGKVYPFDEKWQFHKMGLLQWLNAKYLEEASYYFARLPKNDEQQALAQAWQNPESFAVWKKYLPPSLQPVVELDAPKKVSSHSKSIKKGRS